MSSSKRAVEELQQVADHNFAPGYRFNPTDEELIDQFLYNKIMGSDFPWIRPLINDADVYSYHPKELIEKYRSSEKEGTWYFFSPRMRKYKKGMRPNRKAKGGLWRARRSETVIKTEEKGVVASKLSLKYIQGQQNIEEDQNQIDWFMQEYTIREFSKKIKQETDTLDDYVLCKLYYSDRCNDIDEVDDDSESSTRCKKPSTRDCPAKKRACKRTGSFSSSTEQQQQQHPQRYNQAPNLEASSSIQQRQYHQLHTCNQGQFSHPQYMNYQQFQELGSQQHHKPMPNFIGYFGPPPMQPAPISYGRFSCQCYGNATVMLRPSTSYHNMNQFRSGQFPHRNVVPPPTFPSPGQFRPTSEQNADTTGPQQQSDAANN